MPDTCAALYPGAYPAAVSWWLDSAGEATARVARALAALDADVWEEGHAEEFTELLAETAARTRRVPGWLTAMTRLGLLRPDPDGRPRFAHPLLRDAVLSGWPTVRRQAAHRTAAEVMLGRGDRAEAVAGQLLRTQAVGAAWATVALQDAASVAVRDDRPDDAVSYLRRALDEPLTPARRTMVLTELGSLEFAAARSSAGIPRLTEATRLPGMPHDRVRAAVALGTVLARRGKARAAMDVLRDLDEQLTDHPDLTRLLGTASALLSDHDQGIRQEAYRWLHGAAERSPDLVGTAGQALLVRYDATAGLIPAATAMKRIHALLDEPIDALAEPFLLGTAAAVAQWADELAEAEGLVRRGLDRQSPSLLHPMHLALLNVRADIAATRGQYADLLAEPASWQVTEATRHRPDPANAHGHAVIALVETGRTEGGPPRRQLRPGRRTRLLGTQPVPLRAGRVAVRSGDHAGALDDFLECGRRQTARDVVSPVVTPGGPRRPSAAARWAVRRRPSHWPAKNCGSPRCGTPRLVGRALRGLATATGAVAVWNSPTVPSASCGTPPRRPS